MSSVFGFRPITSRYIGKQSLEDCLMMPNRSAPISVSRAMSEDTSVIRIGGSTVPNYDLFLKDCPLTSNRNAIYFSLNKGYTSVAATRTNIDENLIPLKKWGFVLDYYDEQNAKKFYSSATHKLTLMLMTKSISYEDLKIYDLPSFRDIV